MNQIVRLYININNTEKCIQDEAQIVQMLTTATEPIDLDWHDHRGHAHMGTSAKFAGQTVLVGEQEIKVAIH
jgi:hypothetical protein